MEKYKFDPTAMSALESLRIPFAVYQFIEKRVVTIVLSDGFCDLFGFDNKAEAYYTMDNDMYKDSHPDDVARIANEAFRFATEGGQYEVVYRTHKKNESGYIIVHAKGEHVYTSDGTRLAYVWYTDEGSYTCDSADDVIGLSSALRSELHKESFIKSSYFDELTGLPRMSYFFELADEWRNSQRKNNVTTALLYMDLCGMKFYNQKYGFAEGDKLLRVYANIIKKYFSNENCSRFGSDNFCVYTNAEIVEDTLNKIFEEFRQSDSSRSIPVRVGIFIDSEGTVDIGIGCDRAKYACDTMRKTYLSRFRYFDNSMLSKENNTQYIIDNLNKALSQRWIKVYYQPIVRAANGRVCNEEALARWIDPVKGIISPGEFIPILEEAKLIYKLDLYVAESILDKMKKQREQGLFVVPTSINLSRIDFDMCDMVEEIRRLADKAGISHDMVIIEITESAVGNNFEYMKTQIERFRSLGFPVWMDDFGSGYSALDLLQSIRFDLIKFDMHFMKEFNQSNKSKIILTELMRMAIALGTDTICEGVETKEQVEFLREVGCTKLQGFYFIGPISMEQIFERYRNGTQIGFENPQEADYYAAIGRINLYDLAIISNDDQEAFEHYFNTLPMGVFECTDEAFKLVRCNQTFGSFVKKVFDKYVVGEWLDYKAASHSYVEDFFITLKECADKGQKIFWDKELKDGSVAHTFMKRLAVNPLSGTRAVAVALLAVLDKTDFTLTFSEIAQALSEDYIDLYYVDLNSEKFIEYQIDFKTGEPEAERRGSDFFGKSRSDASKILYEEDAERFINAFNKENVVNEIDRNNKFIITYRLMIDGNPTYVQMKAVRGHSDRDHLIIGISNVDEKIRQKEAIERYKEDQTILAHITALTDNFLCIYTVDPKTDNYTEYTATQNYRKFDIPKEGSDFFEVSLRRSSGLLYPDDLEYFKNGWSKEKMLRDIEEKGVFVLKYHMMINDCPVPTTLKATTVDRMGETQLLIGITT